MAKETFYFSHDYNARNDEKIRKLLFKHGFEGYGIYWALIENLYNNENELQIDYECIAYELRTHSDLIKSIINNFELFEIIDDVFSSNSVQRRLNERYEKSMKARKSAKNRWDNANAMQTHNDSNAIKERKGKEIKEKDIIINNKKLFQKSDLVNLPENIIYNISVKFKSLKQTNIDQNKIYQLWDVFLNENLEIKEYNKIAEIYTHFSNWILKQKFETNDNRTNQQKQIDAMQQFIYGSSGTKNS
ncbi:Domain of unknown function DUF4373 [uncultured Caudovirales phage]|uniref:Lin1244/Lin1753-like N-terminal domain-containing protein n=1 Tax=uncultured Caudovirales phage TaxID=2100421 RepID=A0A6J7WME7_9CAUD|nr:Domain of unknown function DUF4373 [uncultured Caudovirales phage]